MSDKNILFVYDLPKSIITSTLLASTIKDVAGYEIKEPPQIRRNPDRPFYSAMIKINDDKFKEVAQKLKHFNIKIVDKDEVKKYAVRALPYDRELTGANRAAIAKNNVFLKGIKKDQDASELEEILKQAAGDEVKSLKISLNPDHTSRGYGFALFSSPDGAQNAIKSHPDAVEVLPYNPKDKKDMRKLFNNIYVKNFPTSWDEAKLKDIFGKYGKISSIKMMTAQKDAESPESKFAFICYLDPADKLAGPVAAAKAVEQEHEKEYEGMKIYAREALKKTERDQEKRREQLRFKNSKKRCNLYVKNFPPNTTEEELKGLFSKYGEIESVKLFPKEGEALYAFVCYKSPDYAALARQQLNMYTFNGKQLYVNHYELKEVRKLQQEEARDKADFQTLQRSQPTAINTEFLNNPQVVQIINMLIQQLGRNNMHQRQYNNRQFGQRGPQGLRGNYQQQPGQMPRPAPQAMPQMSAGPMPGQSMMMPPQQQMRPQPMGVPMQGMVPPPAMMAQSNISPQVSEFMRNGATIQSAVTTSNPNYKQQVGEFIYEYVEQIVGEEKAPKITGMLIDLHPEEIRQYLVDYGRFNLKISEAVNLLNQTQTPK